MAVAVPGTQSAATTVAAGDFVPEKRTEKASRGRQRGMMLLAQLGIVAVILAVWQLVSGPVIATYLVGKPSGVVTTLYDQLGTGAMWTNISVTAQELVIGYMLGIVFGALVGWALGALASVGKVFEPLINAVNGIPKIALAPLFLLWFGLGIWSKVAQASMVVFFVMFYNVFIGMRTVPKPLCNVLEVMGAPRSYVIRKVVFPSLSGPIFAGLKAGVPFAMIGVIVGEFVASDQGVGYYVLQATQQYNANGLFAGIVIMVVMVLIGLSIVNAFERRSMRWLRA